MSVGAWGLALWAEGRRGVAHSHYVKLFLSSALERPERMDQRRRPAGLGLNTSSNLLRYNAPSLDGVDLWRPIIRQFSVYVPVDDSGTERTLFVGDQVAILETLLP
jgi:hypothetical protein